MSNIQIACSENLYVFEKLQSLRQKLLKNNENKKAMNAKRIIGALERFPLPVLSGRMSEAFLQGVGPFFHNQINKWLAERPQKRQPVDELGPSPKRQVYTPVPGSEDWVVLMCAFYSEEKTLSDYDIPYVFGSVLEEQFLVEEPQNPKRCFESLVKSGLLTEQESKFKLTQEGETLAAKLLETCPESLKKSEGFDPEDWLQEDTQELECTQYNSQQQFESYQIVLFIDTAERLSLDFKAIEERLTNRNIKVERVKLWVGDYMWVVRCHRNAEEHIDLSLNIIVERKTADDLAASIIDGRYDSQKFRLKQTGVQCFYLLEGTKPSPGKITEEHILNALLSTVFNYNFQMKICENTFETLNWLARMTLALEKEVQTWEPYKFESLLDFTTFYNLTNPNKSLTVREVFGKQLRTLGKCGEQSTLAVLNKFPTPSALHEEIQKATSKSKRSLNQLLNSIKLDNGNKISKKIKEKIKEVFV